jgi:cytosine/adenosine deaminase-related metal-dependent hydrolase
MYWGKRFCLAFSIALAACAGGDVSPFDPEDNPDSEVGSDQLGKDDGTGSGCTIKTVAPYALHGTILGASGAKSGYLVLENEKITAISSTAPTGMRVVETHAVIAPGLIDLHNHINYNFIPLWNAGRRFNDRYQWARTTGYASAVKAPYNDVKNAKHLCESGKYGELRGLVGGTTMTDGLSAQTSCMNGLVRNVETSNFCGRHVRQNVLAISSLTATDAATLNTQFASGATRAFLVHLAEGIDDSSRAEFDILRTLGLVKPQVVMVHGTALTPAQLQEAAQAGMKIVWSPLSNLLLYGQTTDIPTAIRAGMHVALAPDWSPSGSSNLLGELKVADRLNRERFGGLLSDKQLVAMATSEPAMIAGMGDKIGTLAPGYYADLVVVRLNGKTPYRALIEAQPADVLLTTISGQALYGDPVLIGAIGQSHSYATVDACGSARELAVPADDTTLPGSQEALEDLMQTFATDQVSSVIPLFQCTPAPESAFQ